MNFYKHYKNKPYRVHGIAKHSETMEDLVVYETLYENPTAKLWVRPKTMFEESVLVNGAETPRFAKVPLQIKTVTEISDEHIKTVAGLVRECLGEWDSESFHSVFHNHPKRLLQLAYVENAPVGFKLGYELDKWTFYSWLGGVISSHRGLGIASDLMQAQHQWCKEQGYQSVQTKTQNKWKGQLLLNIKSGFEITGYSSSIEGSPKIMLEKKL